MPQISIVVPVYNVEKYIARCIDSIQRQTFTDWELILVDDCGNDRSMDIVKQYAKDDSRIIFIESNANVGPMTARDKGCRLSTGEYITFVDGDDTLPKDALDTLYKSSVRTGADIVVGNAMRIFPDGRRKYFNRNIKSIEYGRKDILIKLLKDEFPHNLWGKIYKSNLLRNNKLMIIDNNTNGEDGLLFYQIIGMSNRLVAIDSDVYYYWMYESSSTHKPLNRNMINGMAIFEKYRYDMLSKELGNIDFLFFTHIYKSVANLAKRMPVGEICDVYMRNGIRIDLSIISLRHYFSIITSIKMWAKFNLAYRLRWIFMS